MKKIGIVGGGIVGATAAYYLARAGTQVTLFDEDTGQGTKAAAGIICPWFSLRRNKPWYYLVSQGAEFYRQFMKDLKEDGYNSDAIFQEDGAILIRNTQKRVEQDLLQAEQKRQDSPSIGAVKSLSPTEIAQQFPLIETDLPATWVEGGGRVHGSLLIETLIQAIQDLGGEVIQERVKLEESGKSVRVVASSETYSFDQLLLSVGAGLPALLEPIGYKVDIRTQKGQLFVLKNDHWVDQHWPVLMPPGQSDIIPFNNGELIIGATHEDLEEYDLEVSPQRIQELWDEALNWFPSLADYEIQDTKVGLRAQTSDYSVLVGEVPGLSSVWAISGLGSSGLTSGPFLGNQWAQLILQGSWNISQENYPITRYITL